jgi:hypothetical protein
MWTSVVSNDSPLKMQNHNTDFGNSYGVKVVLFLLTNSMEQSL